MRDIEKSIEDVKQKNIPTYEIKFKAYYWKYFNDRRVKIKSFIFEILAFSKGDIFMLIILAIFIDKYL